MKFKISKPAIIGLSLATILIVGTVLYIFLWSGPGKYDSFATCIKESGTKMYGTYWCPHCKSQKKLFGKSFQFIPYIECSLPNAAGQTEACKIAGIQSYPTWEFAEGKRVEGALTLNQLSSYTNCTIGVTVS